MGLDAGQPEWGEGSHLVLSPSLSLPLSVPLDSAPPAWCSQNRCPRTAHTAVWHSGFGDGAPCGQKNIKESANLFPNPSTLVMGEGESSYAQGDHYCKTLTG